MAQRTIASFFTVPKAAVDGRAKAAFASSVDPGGNDGAERNEKANHDDEQKNNGDSSSKDNKKRSAPHPTATTASRPTKRPTAARPFAKGADIVPVHKATYNDRAVEFCNVDGREYLLCGEAWDCADLTKPVSSWWAPPPPPGRIHHRAADASHDFGGTFAVVKGTRGLVVCAEGGVLRCHRVPRIGETPLATLCLTHRAPSESCDCLGKSAFTHPSAVQCMSSYASPEISSEDDKDGGGGGGGGGGGARRVSRGAPNLMVTTQGGELKLISVEEVKESEEGGGAGGGGGRNGVTMTLVANLPLTEGPFQFALPPGDFGSRVQACVMWRDPADDETETRAETESTQGTVSAATPGGRQWAPVTAAVVSHASGEICFIKISPAAAAGGSSASSSVAAASIPPSSSSSASSACSPCSCSAELRRTVTPHLPGAGCMARYGSRTFSARLWEGGAGGGAVVSVGSDGNIALTHFRGGACAAKHDSAWRCVSRETSGAHMLAVCDRSGIVVTASQSEDDVHVWDVAREARLRKIKMGDAGRPKGNGRGGGGGWFKSQFTLMKVAVGAGGRLVAASNSNRDLSSVLQLVRGR